MRSSLHPTVTLYVRRLLWLAVTCILLIMVAMALPARITPIQFATGRDTAFRIDAGLVLVPVTVTDRNGRVITGLPREAFSIKENGVEQPIRTFSVEEEPVSVGVVFDLSGSMKESLGGARAALRALTAEANPDDEASLETVSTHPKSALGFTNNIGELLSEVASEKARGDTALVDAIGQSLDGIRSATRERRALIVISDGMDNHSRHTQGELLARATEADLQIYTISIFNPSGDRKPSKMIEEQHGLLLMEELADRTGGLQFMVRSDEDMRKAAMRVGAAMRNRYCIGYVPGKEERLGQWRKIQVKVARAGLKAHARTGYRLD